MDMLSTCVFRNVKMVYVVSSLAHVGMVEKLTVVDVADDEQTAFKRPRCGRKFLGSARKKTRLWLIDGRVSSAFSRVPPSSSLFPVHS